MLVGNKINEINRALILIQKPTPKRLRLAADILLSLAYSEQIDVCGPSEFKVIKFQEDKPLKIKLKKFICTICPSCRSHTFDLNTEIMQGQCLSYSFKSSNYKADMLKRTN